MLDGFYKWGKQIAYSTFINSNCWREDAIALRKRVSWTQRQHLKTYLMGLSFVLHAHIQTHHTQTFTQTHASNMTSTKFKWCIEMHSSELSSNSAQDRPHSNRAHCTLCCMMLHSARRTSTLNLCAYKCMRVHKNPNAHMGAHTFGLRE